MVGLSPHPAAFFKVGFDSELHFVFVLSLFLQYLLILIEFAMVETIFNFVLAAVIRSAEVAILLAAILNLFQMAFAGFFVNLKRMSTFLSVYASLTSFNQK